MKAEAIERFRHPAVCARCAPRCSDACDCAALVECRSQVVPGHGAAPATVAFVGLAPGRLGGDRTGIPFSGDRSGEPAAPDDRARRSEARVHYQPGPMQSAGRARPQPRSQRARDSQLPRHLAAELAVVRPRLVACLGAVAWREMAGSRAPFRPRRPAMLSSGGLLLYPMYHPAYVVRGAYPEPGVRAGLRAAGAACCAGLPKSHGRTGALLAETVCASPTAYRLRNDLKSSPSC